MNPEQKVVPQIRTKFDPEQGSFTQVKIHTSVFVSSIQASQVLTLNQGAKRNRGKTLFINVSVGLLLTFTHTHFSSPACYFPWILSNDLRGSYL